MDERNEFAEAIRGRTVPALFRAHEERYQRACKEIESLVDILDRFDRNAQGDPQYPGSPFSEEVLRTLVRHGKVAKSHNTF